MNVKDTVLDYYNWYYSLNKNIYSYIDIYCLPVEVSVVDNKVQSSSCKLSDYFKIRINLNQARNEIQEYINYKNDKEIGNFSGTYEDNLKVIICHEVAHIFTFLDAHYYKNVLEESPHGLTFQKHYRILRNKFVNKTA